MLAETEVLIDSEIDPEILNDADWLTDSDSEIERDSLVETEVLKDSEIVSETLADAD